MKEHPGRKDRELAAALVDALPASAAPALRLADADLGPSAQQILYTSLRRPSADEPDATGLLRSMARIGRAAVGGGLPPGEGQPVVALVTQPIHATLFAPIGTILRERGVPVLVLDAETRRGRSVPGTDGRMADVSVAAQVVALERHAVAVEARLARVPDSWRRVVPEDEAAARRLAVLRRGLPLAALGVARAGAMIDVLSPRLVACFSESGMLARTVPAAARPRGVPVVDLPHAEAADPWGSGGTRYDGVAVYGPRARAVMELAGVARERIVEIGPLRYDELLQRPRTEPVADPRRIVFASQPADPLRPALHPEVKDAALRAAVAAAEALSPAQLVVIPHPTEPVGDLRDQVAQATALGGVGVAIHEEGLHAALPGAWLLVTASSQSVYDAVLAGVPAMTVNPTSQPDPVSFAAEGIAIGVGSPEEAGTRASALVERGLRAAAVAAARAAIGDRIGPLDGRSAERAADWLIESAT